MVLSVSVPESVLKRRDNRITPRKTLSQFTIPVFLTVGSNFRPLSQYTEDKLGFFPSF